MERSEERYGSRSRLLGKQSITDGNKSNCFMALDRTLDASTVDPVFPASGVKLFRVAGLLVSCEFHAREVAPRLFDADKGSLIESSREASP